MDAQIIITSGSVLAFCGVLFKIVWDNLNNKINSNSQDIKDIKNTFATKEDLRTVKVDLEKDTDEIKEQITRLGEKIDRMMELLLERGNGNNER